MSEQLSNRIPDRCNSRFSKYSTRCVVPSILDFVLKVCFPQEDEPADETDTAEEGYGSGVLAALEFTERLLPTLGFFSRHIYWS